MGFGRVVCGKKLLWIFAVDSQIYMKNEEKLFYLVFFKKCLISDTY